MADHWALSSCDPITILATHLIWLCYSPFSYKHHGRCGLGISPARPWSEQVTDMVLRVAVGWLTQGQAQEGQSRLTEGVVVNGFAEV